MVVDSVSKFFFFDGIFVFNVVCTAVGMSVDDGVGVESVGISVDDGVGVERLFCLYNLLLSNIVSLLRS